MRACWDFQGIVRERGSALCGELGRGIGEVMEGTGSVGK